MNWLIDAVALALAVRDPTQTGARQQSNAPRNNRRLVTDDIAKEVARNHHTVQGTRVLDHEHGRAVNQLMAELELRKLVGKHLGDNLAPQPASGEHVGLVQTPDLAGRVVGEGKEASQARDAFDFGARVGLRVKGETRPVVLLAVTKVDAARQLADDDKISAAADFGLERRRVDEGIRGEAARAQVTVGAQLLAQLKNALFGADR